MARMYFIAVVAPGEINKQVLEWKTFMLTRFDCKVALRSPAHVTLIPPFYMDEELENALMQHLEKFSSTATDFHISLKDFSCFNPKTIYINVIADQNLSEMKLNLENFLVSTRLFPIKKEERPFHPHVTIATRDLRKKTFHEAWEIFKKKSYSTSWQVNSLSLLRHNDKNWDVVFQSQFNNAIK